MSTLASHVLKCLQSSCSRIGTTATLSAELEGDCIGLREMFFAWSHTITLYSSQSLLLPPVLTDQEELESFVKLTGAEKMCGSPALASNLAEALSNASAASRPILALSQLLALAPSAEQPLGSDSMRITAQYWVQQGLKQPGSFSQPGVCSIMRCILLTLKLLTLISACSDQHEHLQVQLIPTVLRNILETALELAASCQLLNAFFRPDQTTSPSDRAVGPPQLSAAIMQVLVQLMRASIKSNSPLNNSVCCSILLSLLQQPGSAALRSKEEFMQSGGVMLVLASLTLSYGASRDGVKVLSQLLHLQQRADDNTKLVAWLLQAQAVSRLSTLLEPLHGHNIQKRVREACPADQWVPYTSQERCVDVSRLSQLAETMCNILSQDPLHCPVQATDTEAHNTSDAPAVPASAAAAVEPKWPTPSAKAWHTIQTTALRAAAVLRWTTTTFAEKQQSSAGADSSELRTHLKLMRVGMQLLAKLLTGHMDSSLEIKRLYDAHILKDVIATYQCILEHSSAGTEDLQCIHIFVRSLLCRAREHALVPVLPLFSGAWLPADVDAILNCFCSNPLALSSLPAAKALGIVRDGLAFDSSLQAYFLKWSSIMAAQFHSAVVLSEQQPCHLTAILNIALLCSFETRDSACKEAVDRKAVSYCVMVYTQRTFDYLLGALQHTLQLPLLRLAEQVGNLSLLLCALVRVPRRLLRKWEEDLPQLQQVLVIMIQKMLVLPGKDTPRPRLHEVADILRSLLEFAATLPQESLAKVAKDAFEALTDLVVVSLRQSLASHNTVSPVSKSAGLLPEMLHTVVDWLFVRTSPSDRELMYFGQEAFALVQQWLVTCAEDRKQASHAAGFLTHPVGLGYGRMLGSYRKMCADEQVAGQMPPPVDAACAYLTHLFMVVDQLVLEHKHKLSEHVKATHPHRTANNVLTHRTALKQATAATQPLQIELHTALEGLAAFADDDQMAEGMKQKGSMAWCIDVGTPDMLQQHLTYLRSRMGLSTDVAALHKAFQLTTSPTPAGPAADEQPMLHQQQAAAKAAARKAKKLRQKESKQQAKQAAQPDSVQQSDASKLTSTAAETANHAVQDHMLPIAAIQPKDIPQADVISSSVISVKHSEELDCACKIFDSTSDNKHNLQLSAASAGTPETDSQPPSSMLNTKSTHMQDLLSCPITKVQMADCVIAADGFSYEREAITKWLQHSNKSPVDGKPLQHNCLLPNFSLRKVIDSFSVKAAF